MNKPRRLPSKTSVEITGVYDLDVKHSASHAKVPGFDPR